MTNQAFTFQLPVTMRADPKRKLPAGALCYTCLVRRKKKGKGVRYEASVERVYVSFPSRRGKVATSRAFDDGAIVVDLDTKGKIVGFELLSPDTLLVEYVDFARKRYKETKDLLLSVAPATAIGWWAIAVQSMKVALNVIGELSAELGAEVDLERVRIAFSNQVSQATPQSEPWEPANSRLERELAVAG